MPRPAKLTPEGLIQRFQIAGVVSAQTLATDLNVDRSSVSRGLAALGPRVLPIGAGPQTRYTLRRTVRQAGDRWPLYRIDAAGRAQTWGRLHSVHGGCWWELADVPLPPAWLNHGYRDGVFPGLPFFLQDARPQGFIGRAIAGQFGATLGVPADPRDWQDDDVLAYLAAQGDDVPGDLVLGERMLDRVLQQHGSGADALASVAESQRAVRYGELAEAAVRGARAGSSAGGEQPKFAAIVRNEPDHLRHVLVKFSPPRDAPAGRRWADLLAAEGHALRVLAAHGEEAAESEIVEGGTRRFLEVTRFDRLTSFGRRGVLSLAAIEGGLLDHAAADWPAVARGMSEVSLLAASDAGALQRRWCFGQLIANNDMHLANAAVWFGETEPLSLAPVYDMLPMLWAPGAHGEVVPREFTPVPPRPEAREAWRTVVPWAAEFWRRVKDDATVSDEFRRAAAAAESVVVAAGERWG